MIDELNHTTYSIEGSKSIKIAYDGTTITLYIRNKPCCIVVAGPYQEMSNDYYINCKQQIDLNLRHLDDFINSKQTKFYKDYSIELEKALTQLETGKYFVTHIDSSNFIKYQHHDYNECELICGIPFKTETIIICTKPINALDKDKIDAMKSLITNGERPNVYIYCKPYSGQEIYNYYFIIEGNHLLKAYEELFIKPNLFAIIKYEQYNEDYDEIDNDIIKTITSFEEIRNTSYKYFYK